MTDEVMVEYSDGTLLITIDGQSARKAIDTALSNGLLAAVDRRNTESTAWRERVASIRALCPWSRRRLLLVSSASDQGGAQVGGRPGGPRAVAETCGPQCSGAQSAAEPRHHSQPRRDSRCFVGQMNN